MMRKPVTVIPFPWEAPKRVEPVLASPQKPNPLIGLTFDGKVSERDLKHMAMAILQLSDELFEMRERIRVLEAAIAAKGNGC